MMYERVGGKHPQKRGSRKAMLSDVLRRERHFYKERWKSTRVRRIEGQLEIPLVDSLDGKRVLICSCGSGVDPVRAAKAGAEVFASDISSTAVEVARQILRFNEVKAQIAQMDFHKLAYPADYFDIIYGSWILHHVDCSLVASEIYRCLKPGGIAFFHENSDRNPILRLVRRRFFGSPGDHQKSQFLFLKRRGTTDEYPLTQSEVAEFSRVFKGNIEITYPFHFFQLLHYLWLRKPVVKRVTYCLDSLLGKAFPSIRKYSFHQDILMRKVA